MARIPDLSSGPPVVSLLDVDFYKFTMAQFAFRRHPEVVVRYQLICRNPDANLPEQVPVPAFRDTLEEIRSLAFTGAELDYLGSLSGGSLFTSDFLDYLRSLRLPPVALDARDGVFRLELEAAWPEGILWETLILSALSELLTRAALRDGGAGAEAAARELGRERLEEKIETLRARPGVRFASFGTRRRFSRAWQLEVEERLARALPKQFLGTSAVASAFQHQLTPIGTVAHEVFMIAAVLDGTSDDAIRNAAQRIPAAWWDEYGEPSSLFLTDTWGSEFFFATTDEAEAQRYRGLRHDSGDPVAFGERVIAWYNEHGVDPRRKSLVFSDGLELPAILDLHRRFADRIGVSFGWGTNLTNDCGVQNYSLVVKPTFANGQPLVKLSDDPGKSTGEPAEVARYRTIFGSAPDAAPAQVPKY